MLSLTAIVRTEKGKPVRRIRRNGRIPAVLYGHNIQPVTLAVEEVPFQKVWLTAGESSLVDVCVGDRPAVKALIQEVQRDPATGKIIHVDFHQVNMKEKIEVDIALQFSGEPPAVKELGGTLVKDHDAIKVECLPQDLVRELQVDLTRLKTFDDVLRVGDLALPKELEVLSRGDEILAHVEAPRSEAELAELDTAVDEDVTKVEKVEKPKTEEGEEAAPEQPVEAPKEKT